MPNFPAPPQGLEGVNGWALLILGFLILDALLVLVSEWKNQRAAGVKLPGEFMGILDSDAYVQSQNYLRANTRFSMFSSLFSLGILLAFWFFHGFEWLDRVARDFFSSPLARGLFFIGAIAFFSFATSTLFSAWRTFVIEERFGFNRTTLKIFFLDRIKAGALLTVLGGAALSAILIFFQRLGPEAWIYCWAAVSVFIVLVSVAAPVFILPLFNRFEPLPEGELRASVFQLAAATGFDMDNLFVVDGSRRSTKSNAFFTGFGKKKRIALFDTLIERHDREEILAVLAHEIGHFKKRHVLQGVILQIANLGALFYLLSLFLSRQGLFEAFYVPLPSVYAGLVFFGLLYTPVERVLGVALLWNSRRNERQADLFAAGVLGSGDSLVSALTKLSRDNLTNLSPHPLYVWLHHSHPPVMDRIRSLKSS